MQAPSQADARWLHDQLVPLAPVFLAMTAAVPIWKGYLSDTDVRWERFGDLLDDRRPEEIEITVSEPHQIVDYFSHSISHSTPAGPGTEPIFLRRSRRVLTAAHPR